MKKMVLFTCLFVLVGLLKAQIHYTNYGDGWRIPINANQEMDVNQDGVTDFYINDHHNELGFVSIFAIGCFTSEHYNAYTGFGSRELQLHEPGELIKLTGANMDFYIDDDRGSGYKIGFGYAQDWERGEDKYIGFAVFTDNGTILNGWMKVEIDGLMLQLIMKEMAYVESSINGGGIIVGETGQTVSVTDLDGSLSGVSLAPNPSTYNTNLTFDYQGKENLSLVIQNSIGQEMYRQTALKEGQSTLQIITEDWSEGLYYIRFETKNGIQTEKLVVQK